MAEPLDTSPRLWWTKRLLIIAGVLLVLLILTRLWWGWIAHRRLQRELDLIRASGEPVLPGEIHFDHVPNEQNSVPIWQKAIAAINPNVDTPSGSNITYPPYPPYTPEFHRVLEAGVNANTAAISLAEQAADLPGTDWNIQCSSPMVNTVSSLIPTLNGSRNLANVVGDSAIQAHEHGNDAEAIRRILTLRRLAASVDAQPMLVSHLVAVGIDAMAMGNLMTITPDLAIGSDRAGVATTHPAAASRAQIERLITDLLRGAASHEALHRAIVSERVEQLDGIETEDVFPAPLLRPMFELEAVRAMQSLAIILNAADRAKSSPEAETITSHLQIDPNNYGFAARFSSPTLPLPQPPRYSRIVSGTTGNSWMPRLLTTDFLRTQEQQFTAVSLAIRLYFLDHHAWPTSLDALVPKYLPRVPADLFSTTGAPLGLLIGKTPTGADRPVIYGRYFESRHQEPPSVGDIPPTPMFANETSALWQFRDVSRWYPSPTTQTTQPSP